MFRKIAGKDTFPEVMESTKKDQKEILEHT